VQRLVRGDARDGRAVLGGGVRRGVVEDAADGIDGRRAEREGAVIAEPALLEQPLSQTMCRFVPVACATVTVTAVVLPLSAMTWPMTAEPAVSAGSVAMDTGCVVCQNVPVTAVVGAEVTCTANVPAFVTACDGSDATLTGCVTAEPSTLTAVAFVAVFARDTCNGVAATPLAI
jgi:hypothetical protein